MTGSNGTAPSILVVDDNAANLRLYRATLQDVGAEIHTVDRGELALERFAQRSSWAMVLLDVHLAGISGFDVARRLRALPGGADVPIVFVSAIYTHEADTFAGYRIGAVDYILSPVVPEILRAKVAVFVRLHRMRREAEAQSIAMERAYRELRSAHAEMEAFSYSVSHDLRTPLGQIAGFAQLLQQGHGHSLDAKGQGFLGHIQGAAQRMNRLIDDMLVLARMTRTELQSEPVDLSAMAGEIVGELAQAQPDRHVAWQHDDGLTAQGDPGLLRVALSNLLGNAWKYSAAAPAPQIEFRRAGAQGDAGEAAFCVRDNGAGFDAAAAGERLFRPFQRFHPGSQFPGNGVGLAIAQRVVTKHGGRIWVESAPGRGASFYFTLPPLPAAHEHA
jgi:signal transduction histidine kinase